MRAGPFRGPRVLIVDDDVDLADSLGAMLRHWRCEVLTLYDGISALLVLADFRPQLAILDYQMPGPDGLEVAAMLLKICPTCRSYIFSGLAGMDLPSQARKVEGITFIQKPIPPRDLLTLLLNIPYPP